MGSSVISWISRKQSCVALSIAESEYIIACSIICEAVWHRKLLSELFDLSLDASCIFCDSQSCVKFFENLVFHDRSKHIEIKYHYIRDMVQRGAVKLQYVATNEQIADVLTKPLARVKFEYFRERLGDSSDRRHFEEEVMGHICRSHSKHGRRILPMAVDVSVV